MIAAKSRHKVSVKVRDSGVARYSWSALDFLWDEAEGRKWRWVRKTLWLRFPSLKVTSKMRSSDKEETVDHPVGRKKETLKKEGQETRTSKLKSSSLSERSMTVTEKYPGHGTTYPERNNDKCNQVKVCAIR